MVSLLVRVFSATKVWGHVPPSEFKKKGYKIGSAIIFGPKQYFSEARRQSYMDGPTLLACSAVQDWFQLINHWLISQARAAERIEGPRANTKSVAPK